MLQAATAAIRSRSHPATPHGSASTQIDWSRRAPRFLARSALPGAVPPAGWLTPEGTHSSSRTGLSREPQPSMRPPLDSVAHRIDQLHRVPKQALDTIAIAEQDVAPATGSPSNLAKDAL